MRACAAAPLLVNTTGLRWCVCRSIHIRKPKRLYFHVLKCHQIYNSQISLRADLIICLQRLPGGHLSINMRFNYLKSPNLASAADCGALIQIGRPARLDISVRLPLSGGSSGEVTVIRASLSAAASISRPCCLVPLSSLAHVADQLEYRAAISLLRGVKVVKQ